MREAGHPWHDARLLNAAANALFAAVALALVAAAVWWLVNRPAFTLREVRIVGAPGHELRHVSTPLLRSTVARRVSGNFFTVDLDRVRETFESVPWVRHASVRRVWPSALEVSIEEHRPLAFWGDGRLVNTFGELFPANLGDVEDEGPLPHFSGPPGSEREVVRRYAELRDVLGPIGARPERVALSPRHAWTVRLEDGTTLLLGREQAMPIDERLARWVELYPQVSSRLNRRAQVVDLRYPNGFAIRSLAMADEDESAERAARADNASTRANE